MNEGEFNLEASLSSCEPGTYLDVFCGFGVLVLYDKDFSRYPY